MKKQFVKYGLLTTDKLFEKTEKLSHQHKVGILIDFSGSMNGRYEDSGINRAKTGALVLASFLEKLNIPFFIKGYSAVRLRNIVVDWEIKPFTKKLCSNNIINPTTDYSSSTPTIGSINGRNIRNVDAICNRDGDSIRNAIDEFKLIGSAKTKVLIVLSDGRPSHPDNLEESSSYNCTRTAKYDTILAIKEAKKENIDVVGIGITSDARTFISTAYPNSYGIYNNEDIPEALTEAYLQISKLNRYK